jgi:hypothetical protein
VPENERGGTEIEVMAFGFYIHGFDNGLLEYLVIVGIASDHPAEIYRVFLSQAQ